MAVELVGAWVHSHPDSVATLQRAADEDPSPAVRKKARWYAPDGPVHERTRPHVRRTGQRDALLGSRHGVLPGSGLRAVRGGTEMTSFPRASPSSRRRMAAGASTSG
jgi:hypothetical protein